MAINFNSYIMPHLEMMTKTEWGRVPALHTMRRSLRCETTKSKKNMIKIKFAFGGTRTHEYEYTRTWVEPLRPLGHECNDNCCSPRFRSSDLWVMSPTRFLCASKQLLFVDAQRCIQIYLPNLLTLRVAFYHHNMLPHLYHGLQPRSQTSSQETHVSGEYIITQHQNVKGPQ